MVLRKLSFLSKTAVATFGENFAIFTITSGFSGQDHETLAANIIQKATASKRL